MSASVVQAQYEELERIAARFGQQAEVQIALEQQMKRAVAALESGGWIGHGAAAFTDKMHGTIFPAHQRLIVALHEAQAVTLEIRMLIQQAEEEAAALFTNTAVTPIMHQNQQDAITAAASFSERRTDRRVDERIENDRRLGRPPGGRSSGNNHFDSDWAGRSILDRYLTGGGDWHIRNDPRWTEYMQANRILAANLEQRNWATAEQLWKSGQSQMQINESFAMEIENGEGIVGYQYLHGTNANVGGFQRQGTAKITPDGSGGYVVTMDMTYTWNDIIDPNPNYSTDNWKSTIAEVITLGRAEPYVISISWTETTQVRLDGNGKVVS